MTDETTTDQLAEIEGQAEDTPATKYTPPEGWRVLQVGEALREGDVIVHKHDAMYATARAGGWVGANQRYIRPIEPQPEPQPQPQPDHSGFEGKILCEQTQPEQVKDWPSVRQLRDELETLQTQLGESRQRVTQLEELVGSLRTINEAQEKAFNAAGKANTDLQHRLNVVAAEWAEQAETIRRLQIELDAAQQVPQAIADRFEEGWNQGTARAVETIAEWTEPLRTCGSQRLAWMVMANLPQIMRHLTGLTQD